MVSDWKIERYSAADKSEWDEFVKESRNATFLFERDYMDYHSERFADHSLMAYKGGKLRALLPANERSGGSSKVLHSHQGLTYGGWILPTRHIDAADVVDLFEVWTEYCRERGFAEIDYKPLPYIYATMPSQEDLYALSRRGAIPSGVTISETIDRVANPGFNTLQRRNLKKAAKVGIVTVEEADNAEARREFYKMLCDCLADRHSASPVHTYDELETLISRFPEHIRIYLCRCDGRVEAGVCLYITQRVVHCQYIASTLCGRKEGLLTLLFSELIAGVEPQVRYFDFGTSNEEGGKVLNEGLVRQKSSLGGSGVAYLRYNLKLR